MRAFTAAVSTPPAKARGGAKAGWRVALLLAGATVLAYANTWDVPFFDRAVASGASPVTVGRPLLGLSFALNRALSGEAVWSYHALNLLVHVLAGLTLFGLLQRTFRQPSLDRRFGGQAAGLAAVVAAWWLLHPLQTAAVTCVAQRAESMAGLCYLLTIYGFVRGTEPRGNGGAGEWRRDGASGGTEHEPDARATTAAGNRWLTVSVVACFCGIVTKEVVVTAPLLVLFYDRTWVAGSVRAAWRERRGYYLTLATSWLLLAGWIVRARSWTGAMEWDGGGGPGDYLVTQAHAVALYLKLALWPAPLVFDYGPRWVVTLGEVWPQALLIAGLLAVTAELVWRRSAMAFAAVWFFGVLAPSSSVVPIPAQTVAEHRMYLPLAAVLVLLGAALHVGRVRGAIALGAGVALVLGGLTFQRNAVYRSELTLWQDTVARRPRNVRALHALGMVHSTRQDYAEAVPLLERALKLDPTLKFVARPVDVRTRLAHDLLALGRAEEALSHLEEALRLDPYRAETHYTLGLALRKLERPEIARRHFREAAQLDPSWAESARDVEQLDR